MSLNALIIVEILLEYNIMKNEIVFNFASKNPASTAAIIID